MLIKYIDGNYEHSLNQKFREKRFKFFVSLFERLNTDQPIYILDIGGTEHYWESMKFDKKENVFITLLNLERAPTKENNLTSIQGDACDLSSFKENQFDIVYSNSVIEHLFSFENQKKMAAEVSRVGKNYFVQTPNYYFPIEPHWGVPFFQYLPFKLRVYLQENFSIGHFKKSVNRDAAIQLVDEVKLLTEREMKLLFPDGKVYRETLFGFIKSFSLYRFPQ